MSDELQGDHHIEKVLHLSSLSPTITPVTEEKGYHMDHNSPHLLCTCMTSTPASLQLCNSAPGAHALHLHLHKRCRGAEEQVQRRCRWCRWQVKRCRQGDKEVHMQGVEVSPRQTPALSPVTQADPYPSPRQTHQLHHPGGPSIVTKADPAPSPRQTQLHHPSRPKSLTQGTQLHHPGGPSADVQQVLQVQVQVQWSCRDAGADAGAVLEEQMCRCRCRVR
jgi:hypothetical protein